MPHRFHGRIRERELVLGLLDGAERGEGRALIVEGGEGTGKSALVAEAIAEAERRGFTVATAEAPGGGELTPLAPFFRALGEAAPGASAGRPHRADDPRAWLMEQLWLVEQLPLLFNSRSGDGPLLVTVDDLHRADPATLLALRILPPRLAPAHLVWLVTRRLGDGGPPLDQLFDMLEHDGAARVALDPLDDAAVTEILTDVIGARPGPDFLALAGEADGNPAILVALAEGVSEEGGLTLDGGRAQFVSDRLPRRFHALVADRVAMLSPGARHLLEVASLLDRWFAVDPLADVLGQSPSGLLPVLDEALSAGVLHARGPHLGFWCGLGRRAVAETIPEPVRNALLRQIGTARETGPGSGLAEYPLAARPARSEDEVSATLLAQSARRAWHEGRLGEALDRAQELVRRAAQSPLGDGPAGFTDPRLTLAGMLVDVGRHDEADRIVGTLAGDAERAADPLVAAELATIRARLSLDVGHLDAAEAEAANAEAACAEAPDLGARQLFPRAVCMRAAVAFRRGDLHGAAQHLERHRAALIDIPAAFGSARCRFVEAQLASAEHGAARAVELLGEIYDDLSELRALLVDEAAAAGWMVRTALSAGDHGRATAVAIAAADLAGENPDFPTVVAGSTQARGVLDQDAEALIRSAGDHRQLWARASAAEDAGVVLAEQGDRHRALAQLDQAMAAYHQAGAAGDAGRVRSRLRGLGVRRRHWRQAVRPVCGWASLTDTECSVAGLVAEGLTNRQVAGRMFLSPHTIDFHLRQIFRKLDIGSRVELTRQVVGRDSEGPPDARPVPV